MPSHPVHSTRSLAAAAPFAASLLAASLGGLLVVGLAWPPRLRAEDGESGFRPSVYAIEHVTAVLGPESSVPNATIVVRDGIIEAVGPAAEVTIPLDAERVDATGHTAYAGLIDAFSTAGVDVGTGRSRTGKGAAVDYSSFALGATPADNRNGITPEFLVSEGLNLADGDALPRRNAGFTAALIAPGGGIATGQSALVSLHGRPRREAILDSPVGLHVSLVPTGEGGYPSVTMGFVAHLRQALSDARHYETLWTHFRQHGGARPPTDPALEALGKALRRELRVFWQANSRDEIHRALDLSEEFGFTPIIVGGREAWRVADRLAAAEVSVVLRIDFPPEPLSVYATSLQPYQPESDPASPDGSQPPEAKLLEPPRLLAEAKRKWADRVRCASVLAEHRVRFCFTQAGNAQPADFHEHLRKCVELGLKPQAALAALTTDAAAIMGVAGRMGRITTGQAAHVVVFDRPLLEKNARLRFAFIDRDKFEVKPEGPGAPKPDANTTAAAPTTAAPAAVAEEMPPEVRLAANPAAEKEPYPTETAADREPSFRTGGNVAIRNAVVVTVTEGTLARGTILIQNGKITAVGEQVEIPPGIRVIDAEGLVVMPGIIDTHSHIAIDGGVNEPSLAVVPEVRVRDVVNGEDDSIYRALAGGMTAARLLHGSANPIGGQDAVIKLRWGKAGRDLILRDAPRGVKFALGENPKRPVARYPDTRLGVEAAIRRSFEEGKMYRRIWQLYATARSRGEQVPEPRRDFRLEALAEVVHGELPIHAHCYRADEILMLMRMAESYGIRVKSLQHVLEGYKVAAEIAAHGASNSTFSDWWAYKIEAYDAIPHNAALLVRAGAEVTLKSDDAELMRHMYQEAAKTMRYGGLSETEALATITINAARQLGLEQRLGSIEVGKDADLAIFNGHPLNGFARCEMTLVDGEIYFERSGTHMPSGHGMPEPPRDLRQVQLELPPATAGKYALINAHIVPVVGPPKPLGALVIDGSVIQSIHDSAADLPPGVTSIDLHGLHVYPGMINAGGAVGLTEVGSIRETQDFVELGRFNPDLRAAAALHPDSEIIPVTRSNGILAVLTQPSGGIICGQSVLVNLNGWIPPEMALVDPAALHVNFPPGAYAPGEPRKQARETIELLRQQFRLALRYDQVVAQQGPPPAVAYDPKLTALAPYAKGERLVVITADAYGDILAAIEFAEEFKLKWVLAGAAESWKCVESLRQHKVAVLLGPSMALPTGFGAPYDAPYRAAGMLHAAGVRFAIRGDDIAARTRNLPFQAAMAVAYGLPPDEGLKAVTLYPAQLLGVEDRLGSIEPGKLANLVICDGEMLQPATQVKALFIGGKPVEPTNRHTRLYARYQQRLQEVQAGQALLGVTGKSGQGTGPGGKPTAATP